MTTGTFLAIFLPVSFFIGGVMVSLIVSLLYYARNIDKALTRIEGILKPIAEIDGWLRKRGLDTIPPRKSGGAAHSLPPNEAARRDYLLGTAREYRLTEAEAAELQQFLQKDAHRPSPSCLQLKDCPPSTSALVGSVATSLTHPTLGCDVP